MDKQISLCSSEPQAKVIEGIEPFNDIFYQSCFANSLFPVMLSYRKSVLPILVNDIIAYSHRESSTANEISVNYIPIIPVEDVLKSEGIQFLTKLKSENIIEDIEHAINNERPVILWIDGYYDPIKVDSYQRYHYPHTILIYGFNQRVRSCNVIEHKFRDNLSYGKHTMAYDDIIMCCEGFMDNYSNALKTPVYFEFFKGLSTIPLDEDGEAAKRYRSLFIENMNKNKEQIDKSLACLEHFAASLIKLLQVEAELSNQVEGILATLNSIINAWHVQSYRYIKLYGDKQRGIHLIEDIIRSWSIIRLAAAKYHYSKTYHIKAFADSISRLEQICKQEYLFYSSMAEL